MMSHKIQITVDDDLNRLVKAQAKQMGLSVSSYARLALMSILPKKGNGLLQSALDDQASGQVEALTLDTFKQQIDRL